ncbi:MAG: hypothetical protein ABJD68_17755 [Nakamurella sp.]
MTSSSITDFLIAISFLGAGVYSMMTRLRGVAHGPNARDQHEVIPGGDRRRGDGPRAVGR